MRRAPTVTVDDFVNATGHALERDFVKHTAPKAALDAMKTVGHEMRALRSKHRVARAQLSELLANIESGAITHDGITFAIRDVLRDLEGR